MFMVMPTSYSTSAQEQNERNATYPLRFGAADPFSVDEPASIGAPPNLNPSAKRGAGIKCTGASLPPPTSISWPSASPSPSSAIDATAPPGAAPGRGKYTDKFRECTRA